MDTADTGANPWNLESIGADVNRFGMQTPTFTVPSGTLDDARRLRLRPRGDTDGASRSRQSRWHAKPPRQSLAPANESIAEGIAPSARLLVPDH